MGLLCLKRLMSVQRERRRRRQHRHRQIQARNGSSVLTVDGPVASLPKRKGSTCQQDNDSQGGKRIRHTECLLPEDILCHIHSLMPLRDAARTACVSHTFLSSWRCYPNLIFTKKTLGLDENACGRYKVREFTNRVNQIMRCYSGIGVRAFKLESSDFLNPHYLNRWLQIVITPKIEELTILLPPDYIAKCYNIPCSLLFNGSGKSIMYIYLSDCAFHPTVGLGCLKRLRLSMVCITGDELGCLLSNSFYLEQLILTYCDKISCLKIPCLLPRLSYLKVVESKALEEIDIKAPNLSTFLYDGYLIHLSLGDSPQVKNLDILCLFQSNVIHYTCAKLSSIVPNIETLSINSA